MIVSKQGLWLLWKFSLCSVQILVVYIHDHKSLHRRHNIINHSLITFSYITGRRNMRLHCIYYLQITLRYWQILDKYIHVSLWYISIWHRLRVDACCKPWQNCVPLFALRSPKTKFMETVFAYYIIDFAVKMYTTPI